MTASSPSTATAPPTTTPARARSFGLRFGGSRPLTLRVDWTGDYIINPFNETSTANDSRFDMGMDAMLSLAFGGKPKAPKDTDKDGVPDKTPDLCPDTPIGHRGGRQRLPAGAMPTRTA